MRRLIVLAFAALTACGGLKTVASTTSYTDLWCPTCNRPTHPVGEPIEVWFDWPTNDDPEADVSLHWTIECKGVPCTQQEPQASETRGSGVGTVVPQAPGALTIEVSYGDGLKTEHQTYGPLNVVEPDHIDLACWARQPGALEPHACTAGVARGEDVRIEMRVMAGDRQIAVLPEVTLDGEAFPAFDPDNGRDWQTRGEWMCGRTLSRAGTGVAIGCNQYAALPGTHTFHASYHGAQADLTVAIAGS